MHELSVASNLMDICLEKAAENNASKITGIKLKIGKLSGIEIHFLKEAFEAVCTGSIAENCEFDYFLQDIVIFCKICRKEYSIKDNIFICPKCETRDIKVVDGEELVLMNIVLET